MSLTAGKNPAVSKTDQDIDLAASKVRTRTLKSVAKVTEANSPPKRKVFDVMIVVINEMNRNICGTIWCSGC